MGYRIFNKDLFYYKKLNYGSRKFSLQLVGIDQLKILDNNQKVFKSLPVAGKNDDDEQVEKSKNELKWVKQFLKDEFEFAKNQILAKLSSFYTLSLKEWKEIYLDNGLNFLISQKIVWGIYKDEKLTHAFQVMDDKTFSTLKSEDFTLPDDSEITILHPSDISKQEWDSWNERFADFEIVPLFNQMDRILINTTNLDWTKEFQGWMVKNNLMLFFEKGYSFGEVQDGGGIFNINKEIKKDIWMEIQFHNVINWSNGLKEIPIFDIIFNKKSQDQRLLSALYHEIKDLCTTGSGYNSNWKNIVDWV